MKKIIVTTAICTAFFSTLACAQAQQAGQTPEEIAKDALAQVKALDGKIDNVGKTATKTETRSLDNQRKLGGYDAQIESNKQEIQKINNEVTTKLETYRQVGVGNTQKIDEARTQVNQAVQKVEDVVKSVKKIENEAKEQIANITKNKEKLKELSEKADVFRLKDMAHTENIKITKKLAEDARKTAEDTKKATKEVHKLAAGAKNDAKGALEQANKAHEKIQNMQEEAIYNKIKVAEHDNKIKTNAATIKTVKNDVTTAQQTAEQAQQTGETAQQTAEKAQQTGETAQQTADIAKNTADTVSNKVNDIDAKVQAIDPKIGDNSKKIADHEEKINTNAQKVEKFDKEIEALRSELDGAMGASKANVMKEMNELRNQTNKGLAKVTALAGLHPLAFDKNNKLSLSVASGSYKSEHALALGGFYQPNRDVLLSFGSSVGGNDNAYTVGASVRLGSHSKTSEKQHVSQVAELYVAIEKLQAQVEKQQKEIVQLQRAK